MGLSKTNVGDQINQIKLAHESHKDDILVAKGESFEFWYEHKPSYDQNIQYCYQSLLSWHLSFLPRNKSMSYGEWIKYKS